MPASVRYVTIWAGELILRPILSSYFIFASQREFYAMSQLPLDKSYITCYTRDRCGEAVSPITRNGETIMAQIHTKRNGQRSVEAIAATHALEVVFMAERVRAGKGTPDETVRTLKAAEKILDGLRGTLAGYFGAESLKVALQLLSAVEAELTRSK